MYVLLKNVQYSLDDQYCGTYSTVDKAQVAAQNLSRKAVMDWLPEGAVGDLVSVVDNGWDEEYSIRIVHVDVEIRLD